MGVFRQFPYSNFHEMNMDEIIKIIKNMLEEWATYHAEWDQWMSDLEASWSEYQDDVNAQWAAYQNTMNTAWQSMQNFINNYFDNLDVQEEINNKIISMIQTGEFGMLVNDYIPPAVNAWLNTHITEPEGVVIDTSLSVAGACADAKATGDAIKQTSDFSTFTSTNIINNDNLFEIGNINVIDGTDFEDNNVYRTKNPIDKAISRIDFPVGYVVRPLLYDDNGYVGVWHNGEIVHVTVNMTEGFDIYELQKTYNIRLMVGKIGSTISSSELSNYLLYNAISQKLPEKVVGVKALNDDLANNVVPGAYQEQTITWGTDNKYINPNTGGISDAGNLDAHVSDYIDVSSIPYIRLTSSPYYSFCCLAFYDANKVFIRAYPQTSSTTNYWMEEIQVPDAAKYAVFGNNSAIANNLTVKIEFMQSFATLLNRKWYGKKWACVGDSLTEINNKASMRYMDYIQNITGIKPYNLGKSGTGYANRHAQNEAFYDRISNVPSDSDVVTIFGSFNDVFSSSPLNIGDITDTVLDNTLCGFINGTIDKLYTDFPTAQLGIITPCPWENANPSDTTSRASLYVQAIIDICKARGIACLDLFHCSGMRPWESVYRGIYYTNDEGAGVHPNELGHKIIASHINAFLDTLII